MKSFSALLCALLVFSASNAAEESVKPPVAKRVAKVDTMFGDTRTDEYFWLREKSSPEVTGYLEAENAYQTDVMKPTEKLQETIYNEILSRIKQTDLSVPQKNGDYWYYSRTEEGKQYRIYCRKKGTLEGLEEVTLDLNNLSEGRKFLAIGEYTVSDDGNLLAYSLDTTGFRQYRMAVRDLRTGKDLPDDVGVPVDGAVWSSDNATVFYVTEDSAKRPYRLYRHKLGSADADALVSEEKDELYGLGVYRSSDKKVMFVHSGSSETSEVWYQMSDRPKDKPALLYAREEGHEYYPDHKDGVLYIRTNKDAKNFCLVTVPLKVAAMNKWEELIPHRPSVKLENVSLFRDHAVFTEREGGLVRFKVRSFQTGATSTIDFPEPTYAAGSGDNPEYNTTKFRYSYQSFTTPSSVYEYDMSTEASTLLKQTEVLGGFNPKDYVSERIYATASDGAKIPISIVYKKGFKKNGKGALWLNGYGAYGISMSATFSAARLSMLDRGVCFALAHIRGGGEMGEEWHDMGKMMHKKNTFADFIACAEYLISEKYTSSDRLAISGGSAGGLLIGAVLNMRPDLFKVAHLAVPFVDVINTMLDESLPLTVGEFLEWGNPKKKDEYEYMKSYCPYTNISAKAYPDILVTTSLNDSQVMYWEPAKYTAKMRATKTDKNLFLFKINMAAGHGGASGRYDAYKEAAYNYAFMIWRLLGTVNP